MNFMHSQISKVLTRAGLSCLAALVAPTICAQTIPTCNGLPATIVATAPGQIIGTAGDDAIVGTTGADKIFGLGGNDTICGLGGDDQITGGQGNDTLFGQEGNDTFFWAPGDGSDRIEGASGTDTLVFNGSAAPENVEFSANGKRIVMTRNVGTIALDIADIESIDFKAGGSNDLVVINSLLGTGAQQLKIDLEGALNSNIPDGQPDSIIVFGGTGDDQIAVAGTGNTLTITGAGPAIQIRNSEAALDTLSIYGVDGNDQINAQKLAAGLIKLIIEGGPGHDVITGSAGADTLVGGEGDDTFVWTLGSPADGVLGEAGADKLQVVGSGAANNVIISPGSLETTVQNGVDNVAIVTDVEEVVLQMMSGADQIYVNTAATAKLERVTIDLRPSTTVSTGDGYPDSIIVNGTVAADNISISGGAGSVTLSGLVPMIAVQGSDYARDTLTVSMGPEADVVNAQALGADAIRLVVRGGSGNDTITGSLGNDLFTWSPGDGSDTIDGAAGNDTLQVFGGNISENIALTANAGRFRFTRDIGAVAIDTIAVEQVKFAALGGSDNISLQDLSSTAVRQVAIDLAGPTSPAGDLQPDTILINALTTNAIATTIGPGTMNITWVGVRTSIAGVEPTNDRLILQPPVGAAPALISTLEPEKVVGVDERVGEAHP
jgi:Ca2+-binding RTX toxin-like protein